jgi:hypothetical protein
MSILKKKLPERDQEKLSKSTKESIEANEGQSIGVLSSGINCDKLVEPVPQFDQAECEVVFKNNNNAWIVLGRDRPYSKASGYGGLGGTQCGTIDLVAGRRPLNVVSVTNPNFISDAARVYISQRTNIDANMGLVPGNVGMSTSRSAVGIKADDVRIVARRGIKLVTGTDKKNSRDKDLHSVLGIDLIAGNEDSTFAIQPASPLGSKRPPLQPIPLGLNTVDALNDITNRIQELGSIVSWMLVHMTAVNSALGVIPGVGIPAIFSVLNPGMPTPLTGGPPGTIALFASYQTFNQGLQNIKTNYLLEGPSNQYICSRHNRTN